MWTLVIIIVIGVLIKFFYDKSQQVQKIVKEGGMQHKYRVLLDLLLSGHSNTKIFQVTADSVLLGVHSSGGTTLYRLLQTFGKVTITWTVDSPIYGKHKLEWTFDEYLDQEKMMDKIMNDLKQYQINVMTAD